MSATSYLPPAEGTEGELEEEAAFGSPAMAGTPGRRLKLEEVKGILQRELEDALGGLGSQVSEQQRQSLRHYYGRPLGNEVKDRSQVVMRDVLEVVEWTMPSLMRMFTGGQKIVQFHARSPEGQKDADNATAYINYLWEHKLDGFQKLYDFFKTGLLEKNGFFKVYFEETRVPEVQSWTGLTEDQVAHLMSDESVEPIASEEGQIEIDGQMATTYDITVRKWTVRKEIKLDGIPPEEMLVARRMIHLDDASHFTAQRKKVTVSDLVSMGFDFEEMARIPSDDMPEYTQGRTERLSEDETFPVSTAERTDAASREIWTTDCYMRLDEDGDGYAELRRILIVGENVTTILEDEEVGHNPFVSASPVPMPHKFYGQSLSDLVVDLQIIRSTIMRQILDHIYLANNPRFAITEGMVEVEDMLTVRPGGLVRQRAPGSIEPLVYPPLPREAFETLQYLEDVRANRTGVMNHGAEMDASAINSTATGMAQLQAEKQQKIELVARIYANGLKQVFRLMLKLIVENDTKEQQLRVNNEWITINPMEWDSEMDLTVEVGLGAGAAIERIGNLERIQNLQAQHVQNGGLNYTVTPKNLWESATRLTEACGYRNEDLFFTNPDTQQPPEPPPDPDMKKLELEAIKAEADQKADGARIQLDAAKEKNIVAHRAADLASQERRAMAEIEMRERLGLGQQEATIEAAQINADAKSAGQEKPDGGNEGE